VSLTPRASACTDLTTEDNRTPITPGQRLFNYYDCKWGTVGAIGTDGWFDFTHEDGTRATLNGVRVSTVNPRER
jgi:hypothetical protein